MEKMQEDASSKRPAEEQILKDAGEKRVAVNQTAEVIGRKEVGATRWLGLYSMQWVDRFGIERPWDMCSRTTKKAESFADAVVIFCILRGGAMEEPHILLVKQFRPPVGKYTIEMPAGLIDPGEIPEQAALRELKEECGYVGTVSETSPELCLSPGLSDETAAFVTINIDLSAPENLNPKQELEETEDITVLHEPVSSLLASLRRHTDEGCCVFLPLFSLATALQITQKL
eukprot:m.414092 g.414092  ORF g.414092 m.414092 type:complete len:230 (+) comp29239_c0_seq1:36-725(+)